MRSALVPEHLPSVESELRARNSLVLVAAKEPNLRSAKGASHASTEHECADEIQDRSDKKEETCGRLCGRERQLSCSDLDRPQDHSRQGNCCEREEEPHTRALLPRRPADHLRAATSADIGAVWHLRLAVGANQRFHVRQDTEALTEHQVVCPTLLPRLECGRSHHHRQVPVRGSAAAWRATISLRNPAARKVGRAGFGR